MIAVQHVPFNTPCSHELGNVKIFSYLCTYF
jgi:hypothetical protein